MEGYRFTSYIPQKKSPFDTLFETFMELLIITSGNMQETFDWLQELDEKYRLTNEEYTWNDFINDLIQKGYLQEAPSGGANDTGFNITPKTEQHFRQRSLEQIFGKLKKGGAGKHSTRFTGKGEDPTGNLKEYEFGDGLDKIAYADSFRNAINNHIENPFDLKEQDLEVQENEYLTSTATVLLIDISHSMILYGEDRITPAKKVAMALAELIRRKYKGDTLDIVAFGNDAHPIELKDLPYLKVGPYHTNTVAGLEMAIELLKKRRTPNKQIFMITDGKPTCLKEGKHYYKNSWGLDPKIINKTLNLAMVCRKLKIPVTTFMIASDPYLREFVEDFTAANKGRAFYSSLDGLGSIIFEDFENNKKRKFGK